MNKKPLTAEFLFSAGFQLNDAEDLYFLEIETRGLKPLIIEVELIGVEIMSNTSIASGSGDRSFLPIDYEDQINNLISALKGEEKRKPVWIKNGVDYFIGDLVLVKGMKRVGEYETEIVEDWQGSRLKENKTYLNDDRSFIAIIKKL